MFLHLLVSRIATTLIHARTIRKIIQIRSTDCFAFEILSPCTKIHSHKRLYNAAASSPSRPREGDSLEMIKMYTYAAKELITIAVYKCLLKSLRLSQRDMKIPLSS